MLSLAGPPDGGAVDAIQVTAAEPVTRSFDVRWSRVTKPKPGPPRAIGQPGSGCVEGALALPMHGRGLLVAHPERHREFGHPTLIAFLRDLAASARREKLGPLVVGDLGQPRGGPTPSGHRSHQNGLDVISGTCCCMQPDLARPNHPSVRAFRRRAAHGQAAARLERPGSAPHRAGRVEPVGGLHLRPPGNQARLVQGQDTAWPLAAARTTVVGPPESTSRPPTLPGRQPGLCRASSPAHRRRLRQLPSLVVFRGRAAGRGQARTRGGERPRHAGEVREDTRPLKGPRRELAASRDDMPVLTNRETG